MGFRAECLGLVQYKCTDQNEVTTSNIVAQVESTDKMLDFGKFFLNVFRENGNVKCAMILL